MPVAPADELVQLECRKAQLIEELKGIQDRIKELKTSHPSSQIQSTTHDRLPEQTIAMAPLDPRTAASRAEDHKPASLEDTVLWALRNGRRPRLKSKEIRESLAFFRTVAHKRLMKHRKKVVIDVCGSHGLIGALFACFGKADQAIVLDKFKPDTFSNLCESLRPFLAPATSEPIQQGAVSEAPSKDELSRAVETLVVGSAGTAAGESDAAAGESDAAAATERAEMLRVEALKAAEEAVSSRLKFVQGDFRSTLADVLALFDPEGVLVVGCHACNNLTDQLIQQSITAGVDFAVMPCCHRDDRKQMCHVAKSLGITEHAAIDVARMGAIVAHGYDCRWRTIDESITPENRILVGLANHKRGVIEQDAQSQDKKDIRMSFVYARIHGLENDPYSRPTNCKEADTKMNES